MDFVDLMRTRYTTKVYDGSKKISKENIAKLKEILHLTPSSINSQPWKFTFIADEALKQQFASHSFFNKDKINRASHLVIFSVIDHIDVFSKEIESLSEGAKNYYNQNLKNLPTDTINQWFTNQVYIALGIFLVGCASLGIDSTAMEGIDKDAYTQLLDDKEYRTVVAVAIGYRDQEDFNQLHLSPKKRHHINKVVVER